MTYYKCGRVYTTQNSNVVVDTASGAVANFQTPLAMPLKLLEVDVNAVQDLHGQSGAYPAGGSAQKWDEETVNGYLSSTDGSFISHGTSICSKNLNPVLPSTSYYLYKGSNVPVAYIYWYDSNQDFISRDALAGLVVTTPNNAAYFKVSCYGYGTTYKNDISVNYPATNTEYHPYSNICPISGVSEINAFQRGSNLFDVSTKTDGVFLVWSRGDTYADAKSIVSDYIEVKEGIKFTSNYFAQWCCYDKNKNYLGNITQNTLVTTSGSDRKDNTIPSGYGVYYLRLGYRSALNNDEDMTEKTDIILNIGDTATTFEPYNGSTTLINLGGTYYGGHFTQDKDGKRELVVTHIAYDDWENKNIKLYGINTHGIANFYFNHVSQLTVANVGICNLLTKQTRLFSDTTDEGFLVNPNTQYIRLFSTMASTVDEFKTWATNNDLLIVNELAEPYTIDLPDGQPIKSFAGINNIFCDTGDTSLQFRKIG